MLMKKKEKKHGQFPDKRENPSTIKAFDNNEQSGPMFVALVISCTAATLVRERRNAE